MWTKEGLQNEIVRCIVECNLSMNLVEMPSFRRLLWFQRGANASDADIPHRTKLASLIDDAAYNIKDHLKNEFNALPDGRRVSFTFDGWTSMNMTPYIAVTAHYVSRDWKPQRQLISFAELDGSHTRKAIASHLFGILQEYQLEDKVSSTYYSSVVTLLVSHIILY